MCLCSGHKCSKHKEAVYCKPCVSDQQITVDWNGGVCTDRSACRSAELEGVEQWVEVGWRRRGKREERKPGSRRASTSPFGLARPTPRTGWKGRLGGRRRPWRNPSQSRKGSDQVGYFHKYCNWNECADVQKTSKHGLGQWDNHMNRTWASEPHTQNAVNAVKSHSKPQNKHAVFSIDCTYTRRKGLEGEAARLGMSTVCSGMVVLHSRACLVHGHGSASAGRCPSLRLLRVRQVVGALPFQIAVLVLQGVQLETKQTHTRRCLCL